MRVNGDDVRRWDDLEHLHARPNLLEAEKVQGGVWIELAHFPERGVGHDHRPHLGQLNEQDVPRPAGWRGSEADEALDAGEGGEQKCERDSDPVVDGPHQVRSQGSLVSQGTTPPQNQAGARTAAARECAADAARRREPWPSRFSADNAPEMRTAERS